MGGLHALICPAEITEVAFLAIGHSCTSPSLHVFNLSTRKICEAYVDFYLARSYASAKYRIHFTARFGGVYLCGYKSAESEPIWMKSGAL